jgi:hypothetical protein
MSRGPDDHQKNLINNIKFNMDAYTTSQKPEYIETVRKRLPSIETKLKGNLPREVIDAKNWLLQQDKLKEVSGYDSDDSFDPDDVENDNNQVINTDQVNEEKSWDPEIEIQKSLEVVKTFQNNEDDGNKSFDASETSYDYDLYPWTDLRANKQIRRKGAHKNRKVSGFYIYVTPNQLPKLDLSILLTPRDF